ncbi:MAG: hypothetical protein M0D53_12905 [Flavobacterium sp. JAD_PAG50586_2]|nr:MAG: hypothetical protein M0D53_12905 [Flavobacterium sp. JAD_PAG50586_2]
MKRKINGNRLNQELDFSSLPYEVRFFDIHNDLNKQLTADEKAKIDDLLSLDLAEFNFFQEQDPLAVILINGLKQKGVLINLFQDGLKPYIAHTMSFSPALWMNNIKQNIWIKKNKYPVNDYFSFLNSKMYGFIKGIDQLFLTFPESYVNWKKLPIRTIKPEYTADFLDTLKKVFHWDDTLLDEKERVIFS